MYILNRTSSELDWNSSILPVTSGSNKSATTGPCWPGIELIRKCTSPLVVVKEDQVSTVNMENTGITNENRGVADKEDRTFDDVRSHATGR